MLTRLLLLLIVLVGQPSQPARAVQGGQKDQTLQSQPASLPDWENPAVVGRNKEPAHATMMPYADAQQAIAAARESSPFYRSLNLRWKFHWVGKPDDRPPMEQYQCLMTKPVRFRFSFRPCGPEIGPVQDIARVRVWADPDQR